MKGGDREWQTYAALGLVGKTREAMEGLARFDHQDAAFYSAVALWIDGQDDEAARLLERIPTEHARNLLTLLRKPSLTCLPNGLGGVTVVLTCSPASPPILASASPISAFIPMTYRTNPTRMSTIIATRGPPDFYICSMVEWHLVPPKPPQLYCPLFGHTADYDLHIQTVYPWLELSTPFW